ncbi:hypothetical protein C8Q76DRAFT_793778 [Earliella scabrosa]|nr:hypothetical protein C8Q76DRAFT_793778 [Earliella scabrosa]
MDSNTPSSTDPALDETLSSMLQNATIGPSQETRTRRRPPPTYRHGMSVEEESRYLQQYREWFEEDRNIPPEPAPRIDRASLIAEQYRRRGDLEVAATALQFFMTILGSAKHSSSTPLTELTPVRFSEMLVRRVHVGRYLLCRVLAPCSRMVAIQTVVEDVDGVAYDFSIYNFPSTSGCTQGYLDAIFPVGSILAVREPTFKTPMQGDRPLVRVDSPTDIIFVMRDSRLLEGVSWRTGRSVPRSPEYLATVEAWQQRGNEYFKSSQWFSAAFAYSHGLALNPDAVVLLLNRAEAYLRLGYHSGAVHDAQRVLSAEAVPDVHRGKATFRLAKAQYSRGEYEAARGNFLRWKKDHREDNTADSWIDHCRARITERETGQYDFVSLIRTAKQKIRLDVANYMGSLEVRQMTERGGGRGVVATADVDVGELLMVTKPLVSVYAEDMPQGQVVITLDLISATRRERTGSLMLPRIIEKIYGNPDLHGEVFHLYAGPDYPPPPGAYPPVAPDPVPVDLLEPKVNIDVAQLEAICAYNGFCPARIEDHHADQTSAPTGLYPRASLFNHSCAANAVWYCIGDAMFIRAAEPIPAGTEITLPYSVEESYIDRQASLKKHMLEHCTCWLCEEDRKDGDERLRRRHELKNKLVSRDILSASLAEVRAIEKSVRETFSPTRGAVRPLSALALHVVAESLRKSGNHRQLQEALELDLEALRCMGFSVLTRSARGASGLPIGTDRFPAITSFFEPVAIMLRVACTYLNLHDEASAVLWVKAALWLTDKSVGGGKALFMLIHRESLEQMRIRDLAARVL